MTETIGAQHVAAPWTLRGEAYGVLLWVPTHSGPAPPASSSGVHVRRGGLGLLGFVRYSHSNVGPYDELLWIAPWGLRAGGRHLHSVARIFVSTPVSRDNGRRNWAIPKELAEFDVHAQGPSALRVQVSTREGPIASFVVRRGRGSVRAGPSLLPEALRHLGHVDGSRLFEVTPRIAGRLRWARFTDVTTDAERFIDVRRARLWAAFALTDLEMTFPEATVSALEQ